MTRSVDWLMGGMLVKSAVALCASFMLGICDEAFAAAYNDGTYTWYYEISSAWDYKAQSFVSVVTIGRKVGSDYEDGAIKPLPVGKLVVPPAIQGCPVVAIAQNAFYGCADLVSLCIPETVKTIGDLAFYGCCRLEEINIPQAVNSIGKYAFVGCTKLGDGIVVLDGCAVNLKFAYEYDSEHEKWSTLTLPKGTRLISDCLCNGWSWLVSVRLPTSVNKVGEDAFCDCPNIGSVEIPPCVESLVETFGKSSYGWQGHSAITNLVIADGTECVTEGRFSGCSYLKTVSIPLSVTKIGGQAFSGCIGLGDGIVIADRCLIAVNGENLGVVDLPQDLRLIGDEAFSGSDVMSIKVPSGVTRIGCKTFYNCQALESVVLPDGITTIEDGAFSGCSKLSSVKIPPNLSSISTDAFHGCGLTILTIPENVKLIGEQSFSACSKLKSVIIPETVESVAASAFLGCRELEVVEIKSSSTVISPSAFENCIGLKTIILPSGFKKLSNSMFYGCEGLNSVELPLGMETISNDAFSGCKSLTSVSIPSTVTYIGDRAFENCPLATVMVSPGDASRVKALLSRSGCDVQYVEFKEKETEAGASGEEVSVSLTITNVVIHYVVNSVVPQFANPLSCDTGFVNVITEVKGGVVAVPESWAEEFPDFRTKFGEDFSQALTRFTGKIGADGVPMMVWQDYVAGTDPTNPSDKFLASINVVDGKVKVSYSPELGKDRKGIRKYTIYGKKCLQDPEWLIVPAGMEDEYNFFKVSVEMK